MDIAAELSWLFKVVNSKNSMFSQNVCLPFSFIGDLCQWVGEELNECIGERTGEQFSLGCAG